MGTQKKNLHVLMASTAVVAFFAYSVSALADENTYLCNYKPQRAGNSYVGDVSFVTNASSQDEAQKKLASDFYALYGPNSSNGTGVFSIVSQSCVLTSGNPNGLRVVP